MVRTGLPALTTPAMNNRDLCHRQTVTMGRDAMMPSQPHVCARASPVRGNQARCNEKFSREQRSSGDVMCGGIACTADVLTFTNPIFESSTCRSSFTGLYSVKSKKTKQFHWKTGS